ncbi:hypothetical protein J416_07277 [Gracilibacillus halophilus YIM-C55.5]|uniref:UPF0637 protein J416_07277 n=1 Tax=Gracilibacillus halophilus YIM-C55.5 TaxID=1308866 RepID=N4WA95_9BACI|nr:DUF1054 domain-containing protein [Gracilibacillus halophilus]ENH97223.1 hypothetical protein J416_07277 [Gracilibacillus halophilus YIM-C55.5]
MTFEGFQPKDFDTFAIEGLDERMEAIQERIQPKFQVIGDALADDLSQLVGQEMHLHIAKHARRTVNPPDDTWMALAANKRGYKKHPHFQVGLWQDHLFIWLAYIYEFENKTTVAQQFLQDQDDIETNIPNDFVLSLDHTKNQSMPFTNENLSHALDRLKNVKKAEFLIGKNIDRHNPILQDGDKLLQEIKQTFDTLAPLYRSTIK